MAWHGQAVLIEELLFKTQHGLVDQSLHSRLGAETTNGDGFGVGWYGTGEGPGVYHSVLPAWGDANLRHLAAHIASPLFLSHVRATSGTPVMSDEDRVIVSEPFADLPGAWHEIPEATVATVRPGGVLEQQAFVPRPAVAA